MEKLKKIVHLLDGKGSILVRNADETEDGEWYVHCWMGYVCKHSSGRRVSVIERDVFNQCVTDLDESLDVIIKKLEDRSNGK